MEQDNIVKESMLAVGTLLKETYRIDGYLSSGGFGNTYLATRTDFDERCAVKEFFMKGVSQRDGDNTTVSVSNPLNQEQFDEQKNKFCKEAKRLRKLHNPHIVEVSALFEANGTAYYVMEYVDGESLADRLKRTGKPLSEAEVRDLLPQILDALEEVHSHDIWHLDLKPANIMVTHDGNVKLIDFGASKQLRVGGGATTTSALCFTPDYAAPEQLVQTGSKNDIGAWTDFYALGATLYNLLTTSKPPTSLDIYDNGDAAFTFGPDTSSEMRTLITHLMKPKRSDRPQSVTSIRPFLATKSPSATPSKTSTSTTETTLIAPTNNKKNTPENKKNTPENKPNTPTTNDKSQTEGDKGFFAMILIIMIALAVSVCLMVVSSYKSKEQQTTSDEYCERVVSREYSNVKYSYKYTGLMRDGVPCGKGLAVIINPQKYKGDKYEGEFVNGNFEDHSAMFGSNGYVIGDNATYTFSNGDVYRGTFKSNMFEKGILTIKSDGRSFVGNFVDGQPYNGRWYSKSGELLN